MDTRIKVAIYYRVSTDEQVEQYGIPTQESKIKAWLEYNKDKYVLAGEQYIYNESETGGVSWKIRFEERPQGGKLLQDLNISKIRGIKPPFELVVIYKLDRLARKVNVFYETIQKLEEFWVTLASATENFDLSTSFGKAIAWILWVFAELERDNFMERASAGIEQLKLAGKLATDVYGYYRDPDNFPKVYEQEAKIVLEIYQKYVLEDLSIKQICNYLCTKKVQISRFSTLGKPWKTQASIQSRTQKLLTSTRGYYSWSDQTVRKILSDERYIGKYYYNKTKTDPKTGKMKKIPKEERKLSNSTTPVIIPEDLFIRASEKIWNKSKTKRKESHYLLTGLLLCDFCKEHRLKYEMCSRQGKPSSWQGKEIYQCFGKKTDKNSPEKRCRCLPLNREDLDKLVLFHILQLLKNPASLNIIASERDRLLNSQKTTQKELGFLHQRRRDVQIKLERLCQKFYDGDDELLTEEKYKEYKQGFDNEIQETDKKIIKLSNDSKKNVDIDSYLTILKNVYETHCENWNFPLSSISSVKRLLQYLVKRIVIYSKEKAFKGNLPWRKTDNVQAVPYKIHIELKLPQEYIDKFFSYDISPFEENKEEGWSKAQKKDEKSTNEVGSTKNTLNPIAPIKKTNHR